MHGALIQRAAAVGRHILGRVGKLDPVRRRFVRAVKLIDRNDAVDDQTLVDPAELGHREPMAFRQRRDIIRVVHTGHGHKCLHDNAEGEK
jgi:hypothetical protein